MGLNPALIISGLVALGKQFTESGVNLFLRSGESNILFPLNVMAQKAQL